MATRTPYLLTAALAASVVASGAAYAQRTTVAPPIQPDARTGEIMKQRQALLARLTPVTDAVLRNPPPGEWLQWRRTLDAQGFSPLTQIDKGNVADLRSVWAWSLPAGTTENTPLVHDGVMFIWGAGDRVQALDATTGDLLWEYVRSEQGAGGYKRSIALYGDRLYFPTNDNHVVAIEAKTGKLVWDQAVTEGGDRYSLTSGPLVVKGKVYQGVSGCSGLQPGGCYVVALDAETGRQIWRFNTLARPGEPGGDTWNGLPLERRNGGSVWTTPTYDPELDLIYVGTGNTYNWQELAQGVSPGRDQPGVTREGLYLNSTIALNPETGKPVWHYQHLPEEPWDLDFAFERQIVTIPVGGQQKRVVLTTGKTVITDGVEAATGKWVFSTDQGVQNVVSRIDPSTGEKTLDPEALPDLTGRRRNLQCPAGYGAKNFPANAYNPSTRILYISIAEVCGESLPREYNAANPYKGGGQEQRIARYLPGSDGNIGRLDAVDLNTRKTLWSVRQRASMTGAVLATAGGVVFTGDADRWFKAYDDRTGKVLWETRLNDAVNSYPITYSVNGRQYVAIVAGYGGPRIGNLRQLTTEILTPRGGGSAAVWVFALPQGRSR